MSTSNMPNTCSPCWAKTVLEFPSPWPRLVVTWAVVAALGAVPLASAAPPVHTVVIEGMRFIPENLMVRSGERIVWVNKDVVPHTVTQPAFDSHAVAPNDSWSYVAGRPGIYPYQCSTHPAMRATLIVQ